MTLRLHAEVEGDVARAAAILRDGGLVAFPTETVYGLGANALDPSAVSGIFAAKARPFWDPLIVHVHSAGEVDRVATISPDVEERYRALATEFWPGPLTMLLPRAHDLTDIVTAGRERVGVRVPSHPVAERLLRQADLPVAAPSANLFGHISPTTAAHVLADLDGRIDAVLDGGPTRLGLESTVLDVASQPMKIYRPGAISAEAIQRIGAAVLIKEDAAGTVSAERSEIPKESGLPSPGFGLRHYAPRALLVLVESASDLQLASSQYDGRVGVLLPLGWTADGATSRFEWGPWDQPDVLAARLYAGMRALDDAELDVIVCPLPPEGKGILAALRNRLLKAAISPQRDASANSPA